MRMKTLTSRTVIFLILILLFAIPRMLLAATGIMGALGEEIADIRKDMALENTVTVAGRSFFVGKCEGRDIVLVKSEIGKVNAAMTAQILIDKFNVDRIIFTGVAGGVDEKLKPGDIVIATKLAQHDYGIIQGNNLTVNSLLIPRDGGKADSVTFFDTDSTLAQSALDAAKQTQFKELSLARYGKHYPVVTSGIIVTGDQFIASAKKREWLKKTLNASAVEMEGGAVAQVCETYRVPYIVIRAVSDLADDIATDTFIKMKDTAALNSAMLVENMLKNMNPPSGSVENKK